MSASSKKLCLAILFALLSVGAVLFLVRSRRESPGAAESTNINRGISPELAAEVARLEARERRVAETVWAPEILAQECGRTFESLWDSINAATNKLSLAASFPVGEIVLGKWNAPQTLPHGIQLREPAGAGRVLSADEWRRFVEESESAGWQLAQTEFRHNRFESDEAGQPRQSRFYFSAHLTRTAPPDRAIVEGDLVVDWAAKRSGEELATVNRIDASRLTVKTRKGEPPFRPVLQEQIAPLENSRSIDPLILYDLDGDGLSEIVLAAKNIVYRRRGEDRYLSEPLCAHPPGLISSALIADFDGDGSADFLCKKYEGLHLFKGSPQGTFDQPGRMVWPTTTEVKDPMALTCGDIDHDGDLDVFLVQYKAPYDGGQMPTPYYDANDGYPVYLLLNDGRGNFTDATRAAGLGQKRWRRSYSASFVDLDEDGHLDLVVVSDFAGVDLYRNDGHGHFADVTRQWIAEPHGFGMAHALADFNADGRLDLLMIGMTSPTAERLEHLGLWRPGSTEDPTMRSRMTAGSRLYLGRSGGGFEQTRLSDSIAHSGWSWGCSAFDFDNDGFPDGYIANGMESKESVRDYEGEFWLHDSHVANSTENAAAYFYLKGKVARMRGHGESYGGYEKNRLFMNRNGESFVEIGHLVGVALEQDSRNVVADDLDGDGRVDLLVTSFEAWPEAKQTLRVFRNTLSDGGNWIGFHFREEGAGTSSVGARVAVRYNDHSATRQIVTGDSYRSQHANTVHFGLGGADRVDRAEIQWPNGETMTLREPAVNRYHFLQLPSESRVRR